MAKFSNVYARNELQAARKDKAKAILDNAVKGFNQWTKIRDFIEYGMLFSVRKDDARLSEWLETGYVEIVEPEPCEKELSVNLSDSNRIALQPTDKGIIAYYWFTKYNEQCHKTSEAYELGKKGAVLQVFNKIVKSLDMDFEELCADVADNQKDI